MKLKTMLVLLVAALGSFGCEGKIGLNGVGDIEQFQPPPETLDKPTSPDDMEPPPGATVNPDFDPEVDEEACQFIDPGSTPLKRLTGEEYHNSVRDVFSFATIADQTFTPDERVSGFEANTISSVAELQAEEYQGAAEAIAETVVASIDPALIADEASVRGFITEYGTKLYRRPLEADEVEGLYTLYAAGQTDFDAETGAQMVVEAMLQSPSFLYRAEVGEPGEDEVVALSDYEIAARLSYFLWGTTPDDLLLAAAAAGELSTAAEVEAHARRMIGDDRARVRINEVFTQWLRVDELSGVDNADPVFTDEVRASMVDETRAFIDHVIWDGEGTVSELLTADYTFVDANTAALYGVQADTGGGMVRVDLPPGRRGILSQPGVLTMHGHGQAPVHRGKFIRDAFLCVSTGAAQPPNEIEPLPTFEGESLRSKAEKRMNATTEGCAGCHGIMDSTGLAFDNFDSLGRYQTVDEFDNPLNGSAEIRYTDATDGEVNGVAELAEKLATSPDVNACVSAQFFRYAFARLNGTSDACSLHMVNEALATSGNDIQEMLIALTTTDAFLYRRNLSADM